MGNRLIVILFLWGGFSVTAQNPCLNNQSFHIVVLGSSTAAGTGPSSADSTWVNRYRKHLQNINSANRVSNLAQGGTTTYHIMPDWFSAPAGRPQRNTARNVSEALRLNADAIIVNMPSNDAANNFTVAEQLANFRTMVAVADSAGIPVWICTTQPRNFSTAQKQLQLDVRDSVLQIFGTKAIDFWSGLANSTHGILNTFDSGDGVHLNDAGHKLLYQRVVAKNLLSHLTDTLNRTDLFLFGLSRAGGKCGSIQDQFSVHLSNAGISSNYALPLQWQLQSPTGLTISYDTLYGSITSCSDTNLTTVFNTAQQGNYNLTVFLETQNDSILGNDTLHFDFYSDGLPGMVANADSVCQNESAWLTADGGDTTRWFDSNNNFLAFGDSLLTDSLKNNMVFRAQIATAPFHYAEELSTISSTNVNWRGIMFALVASDSLVLDSLNLKIQDSGWSVVNAYYLNQNYVGFENNASAWTFLGSDSVFAPAANSFASANYGHLTINAGDTLSVYLQMPMGENLQYANQGSPANFQDPKLELISGTGIAGTFGTTYYPRVFSGSLFYHHGFKADGLCQRDTFLQATVRVSNLNIFPDTLRFNPGQSMSFQVPTSFTNVLWSNGSTGNNLSFKADSLSSGQLVWVQAEDKFGCLYADTARVIIGGTFGLEPIKIAAITFYPNPSRGEIFIENTFNVVQELELLAANGTLVWRQKIKPNDKLKINLPPGLYYLFNRDTRASLGSLLILKP